MKVEIDGGEFIPGQRIAAERQSWFEPGNTAKPEHDGITFQKSMEGLFIVKDDNYVFLPWEKVVRITGKVGDGFHKAK